jgi:ABC-type transport system involved in multi-copper enzyme maturation permease subunit
MRAYELMKETFLRRTYIWIVHLSWFAMYGLFWWLFVPTKGEQFGEFIFVWGGFFLPLALSAGIFGDDIGSGRICVLITKPFWSGELYIYRLLGLSLQAAGHFILAGGVVLALHAVMGKGTTEDLGIWLLASWLLFNTVAALSTSLSVVMGRAFNSLLLLVVVVTGYFITNTLMRMLGEQNVMTGPLMSFIRYAWPPFGLLQKFAGGEYGRLALTVGRFSVAKDVACVVHSLMLTVAYSVLGIVILGRREFSRVRD